MRVNQLLIKESGVLKNIQTSCSQVNLIVGDNERGKTTFLNWISKGLFEKNQEPENFESFYPYYDGERMKNLLFIKETDLLFKYKNQEELYKHEYWNNEIHTLLYGNDDISPALQKTFLRSMGVKNKNSWLIHLHDGLFNLKNTLEDMLPEIEKINSKAQGLFELNNSLGSIHQTEKEFHSKEELFFALDKIKIGKQYLSLLEQYQQIQNNEQEIHDLLSRQEQLKFELTQKDDLLLDSDLEIDEITTKLSISKQKEQQVITEPFEVYNKNFGEIILNVCIGLAMSLAGLSLAFQTKSTIGLSPTKLVALICFITGAFYLLKTIVQTVSMQKLSQSSQTNPNLVHKSLIKKVQEETKTITTKLDQKQQLISQLKNDTSQIRKELKNIQIKLESCKKDSRNADLFKKDLENSRNEVLNLYHTDDEYIIQQDIVEEQQLLSEHHSDFNYEDLQQLRQEKQTLMQQQTEISNKYGSSISTLTKTIKAAIAELQSIDNQHMIKHFYPELYSLHIRANDLSNYIEILETVEFLINKVGNDRYRAEKLVSIFHQIESNSETLLSKTLESRFFQYLTQNIFGGKYHQFITKSIPKEGIKIFAETHDGELYPLETLSAGTYAQFWFVLRLALAKSILKDQPGVLLLDDPFTSFDSIRKQHFLDAINALVHQGWQIFITITDDNAIYDYFNSVFQPVLTVVDLNKDYK